MKSLHNYQIIVKNQLHYARQNVQLSEQLASVVKDYELREKVKV